MLQRLHQIGERARHVASYAGFAIRFFSRTHMPALAIAWADMMQGPFETPFIEPALGMAQGDVGSSTCVPWRGEW